MDALTLLLEPCTMPSPIHIALNFSSSFFHSRFYLTIFLAGFGTTFLPFLMGYFQSHSLSSCPTLLSLLTYLLTPWCRVFLQKLTGLRLVKKFPAFHGTRRFITALTSVRHLSLSWVSPIQSIDPHPTFWRSIIIKCAIISNLN